MLKGFIPVFCVLGRGFAVLTILVHPRKFSHLTQKVQRALNSGIDRVNADTAMEQASVEGGLAATTMVKLTPGPRPTSKEGTSIKHTEWCVIRNAHPR